MIFILPFVCPVLKNIAAIKTGINNGLKIRSGNLKLKMTAMIPSKTVTQKILNIFFLNNNCIKKEFNSSLYMACPQKVFLMNPLYAKYLKAGV